MARRHSRSFGLLCVLATAALASGCSSSSSSGGSGPDPSAGSAKPLAGHSKAAAAPAAGRPIDVCATVDAAKARQLSGQPLTKAVPGTGLEEHEYQCAYSDEDSEAQVQLTVFETRAKASYSLFSTQSKNVTTVSGLGDKAFYDNDETMYVLAGNDLIQVNGVDGADHCAALARALLPAL